MQEAEERVSKSKRLRRECWREGKQGERLQVRWLIERISAKASLDNRERCIRDSERQVRSTNREERNETQ